MRYISPYNLELKRNNGEVAYRFRNGVLDLGAATIDATANTEDAGLSLHLPWANDSTASDNLEKAGLGVLATPEYRDFYEAPLLTSATFPVAGDGLYYEVKAGTVEYDGVFYYPGQVFRYVDETLLATLDTSHSLAVTFPPGPEVIDMRGEFLTKHLLYGDEPLDYPTLDPAGYKPRSGLNTDEDAADYIGDGMGYIR